MLRIRLRLVKCNWLCSPFTVGTFPWHMKIPSDTDRGHHPRGSSVSSPYLLWAEFISLDLWESWSFTSIFEYPVPMRLIYCVHMFSTWLTEQHHASLFAVLIRGRWENEHNPRVRYATKLNKVWFYVWLELSLWGSGCNYTIVAANNNPLLTLRAVFPVFSLFAPPTACSSVLSCRYESTINLWGSNPIGKKEHLTYDT